MIDNMNCTGVDTITLTDTLYVGGVNDSVTINLDSISTIPMSNSYDDYINRVEELEGIVSFHEELRKNNPALQHAYEQYMIIYNLIEKGINEDD